MPLYYYVSIFYTCKYSTWDKIIEKIISETGASSIREMGKVMGVATKQLAGKADNKTIAAIVKQILGG